MEAGDNQHFDSLLVKAKGPEKLVQAVNAKTSSTSISFGKVQLRSKAETRDFVTSSVNPNLRGFYVIISLLDLINSDQKYTNGL